MRVVHRHATALIAIAALAAQILFPHFHPTEARAAASTVVGRCTADCPGFVADASTARPERDADPHSPASCPLCRAQSDARATTLPGASAVPLLGMGHVAPVGTSAAPPSAVFPGLASPRAPPVVS